MEALLLVAMFISNPLGIERHFFSTRLIGLILIGVMSLSNTASALKLIDAIIAKTALVTVGVVIARAVNILR